MPGFGKYFRDAEVGDVHACPGGDIDQSRAAAFEGRDTPDGPDRDALWQARLGTRGLVSIWVDTGW